MLGAVIGDIAAAPYLRAAGPVPDNCVIWREGAVVTGASVGVIAVADALLDNAASAADFSAYLKKWDAHGAAPALAAVRAAPCAWAAETPGGVVRTAAQQAAADGNTDSAAEAAVAFASACYMAREGAGRRLVRDWLAERFGYDMRVRYDALAASPAPETTPHDVVRLGLIAALWADNAEGAVKNALRLGGGPMCGPRAMAAGAAAQALYGLESLHQNHALDALGGEMESTAMVFRAQY